MSKFGLIGKDIDYSFSRKFFTEKFQRENLDHSYQNFDIKEIESFKKIISAEPNLKGLNVTIPYKEAIIPFLDKIDPIAAAIGAVNTIRIEDNRKLIGYNTDYFGFTQALTPFLPLNKKSALILGTGGASKAVSFALKRLGFNVAFASRKKTETTLPYAELSREIVKDHLLIINTTPLGTYPNIKESPPLPYDNLTSEHLLFDLIYNPAETEFLKRGKEMGSKTINGLRMLEEQALKAWQIWNS